jgi:hypothetical protein
MMRPLYGSSRNEPVTNIHPRAVANLEDLISASRACGARSPSPIGYLVYASVAAIRLETGSLYNFALA